MAARVRQAESRLTGRPAGSAMIEICFYQVDETFCQFWSNLLLDAIGEMKPDVVFEHFSHDAIDGAANRWKRHQLISAIPTGFKGSFERVQLPA